MQTPGTALIVAVFLSGQRLAFEHALSRAWFREAMKEAGKRIRAHGGVADSLVVIEGLDVMHYNRREIQELTGVGA